MAATTVNDIFNFCNNRGSPVYSCSLDAEGAFDAIPHCIIFDKLSKLINDDWWCCIYNWYTNIYVKLKWNNIMSKIIFIKKGTRQGGLSSPFIFNIFYKDLIDGLNNMDCGIVINNNKYNVFCYADDLFLTSLTVTGLQQLIDFSNNYIQSHGLRFNPSKTFCTAFGKTPFNIAPSWQLNGIDLTWADNVTYLGVKFNSDLKGKHHVNERISKCQRAFYALQGVGLCKNGCNVDVKKQVWNSIMVPTLTYGLECINLKKSDIHELDVLQSKLIKAALGLPKFCRNTPLLHALNVPHISEVIKGRQINLLYQIFVSDSKSRCFYSHLLNSSTKDRQNTLIDKVLKINNSSLCSILFNNKCRSQLYNSFKSINCNNDGLCDSVKFLLFSNDINRIVALLKPF